MPVVPQSLPFEVRVPTLKARQLKRNPDEGSALRRLLVALRRLAAWWFPVWVLTLSLTAAGFALAAWVVDPLGVSDNCQAEQLGCGISTDLIATALVASLGYFALFFRQRNRVIRHYFRRASTAPEQLVEGAGAGSSDLVLKSRIDTRDEVINMVNAARRPDPILIVGDAGVGKTALLAAITKELGERKRIRGFGPPSQRVPIPVTLRPGDPIDFEALARRRFLEEVADELDSPQQGGVIWRKVQRSLGVVVLVDGLHQLRYISKPVRDRRIAEALAACTDKRIAVVLNVRTNAVPATVSSRAFALEHFDQDQTREYLEERLERDPEVGRASRSSRPTLWPPSWEATREWLERLGGDDEERRRAAHEEQLLREGATDMAQRVHRIANRTGVDALRTPFYLDMIAKSGLDPGWDAFRRKDRWSLQRQLVNRYVNVIATTGANELTEPALKRTFTALEEIAPQMLVDDGELDIGSLRQPSGDLYRSSLSLGERRAAISTAVDLGLVERNSTDDPFRFSEPSLNAYFAARRFESELDEGDGAPDLPLWWTVLERTASEELMMALAMFAAGGDDRESAEKVCQELTLRALAGVDDDNDLRLARTAAEIACRWSLEGLYPIIAQAAGRTGAADRLQKLRLFRSLSELGDEKSYRTLLDFAFAAPAVPIDWGDFILRWAVTKHLVMGRQRAFRSLKERITETVELAESVAQAAAVDGELDAEQRAERARAEREGAIIGWILPGMRRRDGSVTDREIDDLLERMLDLALGDAFHPTTIQNALARGFKIDALSRRRPRVDKLVRDRFLPQARFWHARICLVHAVAIPCFDVATFDNVSCQNLLHLAAGKEPGEAGDNARRVHPMVAQAAKLCREGIYRGRPKREYIWEAEGHATSQPSRALTDETAQLVADVAILMSLIYSRRAAKPGAPLEPEVVTDIPHCLATSRRRTELFKKCNCQFHLCPFPENRVMEMVRGELSQAFCRRQSEIARAAGKTRLPWHPNIKPRRLDHFWQSMERERAAKRPLLQWWETMTPPPHPPQQRDRRRRRVERPAEPADRRAASAGAVTATPK